MPMQDLIDNTNPDLSPIFFQRWHGNGGNKAKVTVTKIINWVVAIQRFDFGVPA